MDRLDRLCTLGGRIFNMLCFIDNAITEGKLLIAFLIPPDQRIGGNYQVSFRNLLHQLSPLASVADQQQR